MANPTLLEMPIARDGAKNSIPSTTSPTTGLLSQQYGWQDINSMPVQQGGKAPSRLDFNGVLNLLSNILFYTQKGWQFEWDSSQAYYAGCIVKDTSDGKMYMCINDVTSTTAPHSDTTNWQLWDLSMLANYLPLAGGAMTGRTIERSVDNDYLQLRGGNNYGAYINLYGNDFSIDPMIQGTFSIDSHTYKEGEGIKSYKLRGYPNGSLQWIKIAPGTTQFLDLGGSAIVAQSNIYIKCASGLIIQRGVATADGTTEHTFPISFSSDRTLIVCPRVTATGYFIGFDNLEVSDKLTKFKLDSYRVTDGAKYNGNMVWFAIGY